MKHLKSKYSVLLTFVLVTLPIACKNDVEKPITELHLPDINALFDSYETIDSLKDYSRFANKLIGANEDLQSSQIYVEAASLYHQDGKIDKVIELLHKAIDHGMANPKIISKYEGLNEKLTSSDGKRLEQRLDSIHDKLKDISHFGLEMESMNQFWSYFERAKKDPDNAKVIFKEFIFEGPSELRDFYVVRYLNLENMYAQIINASPDYYEYLKGQFDPDSLTALKSKTSDWMRTFKKIYPKAVFPKVFVVPGILNSGGTATEMGMFVGGDMYGRSDSMPTQGLNDWQKEAIMNFAELPKLTLHELMHFQQSYRDTKNAETVMGAIIAEGVCDFFVELSSGEELVNENLAYLEDPDNMTKILADLQEDLLTEDNSRWLYNGESIEDRPHDLGYTLGYLISKSYYENHKDKQQAIYELFNTDDFTSILKGSSYAFVLE
ncbi:MAG: hypothetical protein GY931_04020 [Maribacter sp.]|nr:hypothetical protein [Maribacter sp.]